MNKFITLVALCLSAAAFAATETVEILDGGSYTATAGRIASVRVLSTAASGAFTLNGIESWDVSSNVTTSATVQVPVWRRVITNGTASVTNDYPDVVAFAPPPPWLLASEGWATNTVTSTRTRRVRTGETLAATNALASGTCSAGSYTNAPTGVWLSDGETVTFSFSTAGASGRALLVIER